MQNTSRIASTATTEANGVMRVRHSNFTAAVIKAALAVLALGIAFSAFTGGASGSDRSPKRILLEKRALPNYRWGLVAYRGSGAEGGKRPCITAIIYFRADWGISESDDTICGPLPPGGPPEIRSYSFGSGSDTVTIVAALFERRVESVNMNLGGREIQSHLHIVNDRQKRIAAIRPFRFKTFVVRGPFCLGKVTGFDAEGNELYKVPPEECTSS